jgi:Phage capsid family
VSFDETESEDDGGGPEEDESLERPYGARPYGARPYGARPYGARPYGARPYGARPSGARPYGARPYGARPYGARPYGARPYGARPGRGGELLDPEEWTADLTSLLCEFSAVIRLGATVVSGEYELRVGSLDAGKLGEQPLRPRDNPVRLNLPVPNRLVRDLAASPELADGLKADLAAALASGVDRNVLAAIGGPVTLPSSPNPLSAARAVVSAARAAPRAPLFRNPGWILSLGSLDKLTKLKTVDCLTESAASEARSLDSFELLRLDGAGGGLFLGFPFATSEAAGTRIYLAADWREAWIGVDRTLVTVDTSAAADFPTDMTSIRASMSYDFALRRPQAFMWAPV